MTLQETYQGFADYVERSPAIPLDDLIWVSKSPDCRLFLLDMCRHASSQASPELHHMQVGEYHLSCWITRAEHGPVLNCGIRRQGAFPHSTVVESLLAVWLLDYRTTSMVTFSRSLDGVFSILVSGELTPWLQHLLLYAEQLAAL